MNIDLASAPRVSRGRLIGIKRPVLGAVAVVLLTITLLPIPVLVWLSLVNQRFLVLPPARGYTLDWFINLPEQRGLFTALGYSIYLGLITAVISTAIGVLAAFGVRTGVVKRTWIVQSLLTLPLTVPGLVASMAIYMLLFRVGDVLGLRLTGSFATLLVGHLLLTLPWAFRIASAGVLGIDRDLERASLDLGWSRGATFFRITLPLLKSTIFSAATLAFIFSFENLEMSLFLVAPGSTTLPVAMLNQAETQVNPGIAAMAVVQLALIAVLLTVVNKLFGLGRTFTGGNKK